jgi:uncharacterized membrane protein YidH (DUF202 family)
MLDPSRAGLHGAAPLGAAFLLMGVAAEVVGIARYLDLHRRLLGHRPARVGAVSVVVVAGVVTFLGAALGLVVFADLQR